MPDDDGLGEFFKDIRTTFDTVVTLSIAFVLLAVSLIVVSLLLLTLFATPVKSAPAPFPKRQPTKIQRDLTYKLTGTWKMHWGSSVFNVVLSPGGHYACDSGTSGIRWTGSWHVYDGKLWISETSTPQDQMSWKHFGCKLCPYEFKGEIVEGSYTGTLITLIKP